MADKIERAKLIGKPGSSERLLGVVDRIIPLLVLFAGLCLLRLLYGIITREFASFPQSPEGTLLTPQQQADLRHSVFLTTRLLAATLWLLALICFARYYQEEQWALAFGAIGVFFMLGMPWLVGTPAGAGSLLDTVAWSLGVTGRLLVALSLLRFGVGLAHYVFVRKPRARRMVVARPVFTAGRDHKADPEAERPRRLSAFRHCWELSQCKGALRVNCPNYRQRSDCWKQGSGCQCDPKLASQLVAELDLQITSTGSEQERRAAERMKENVLFRSSQERRPELCRQCELFSEHQAHKFKALYWIAYPTAIAVTGASLPLIHRGYVWLLAIADRLFGAMQLLPDTQAALGPFITTTAEFSLEPIFILSAGLIIVSYLIDTMDYLIFEVKV